MILKIFILCKDTIDLILEFKSLILILENLSLLCVYVLFGLNTTTRSHFTSSYMSFWCYMYSLVNTINLFGLNVILFYRMNGRQMLKLLRGKRLVFVGDSLNRNMWESLVCILKSSVKHPKNVFEAYGRHTFRTEASYSFVFKVRFCTLNFGYPFSCVLNYMLNELNVPTIWCLSRIIIVQ